MIPEPSASQNHCPTRVHTEVRMPAVSSRHAIWSMVHAERAALADDLAGLDRDQWRQPSLCGRWTVEEVVAHLTAAASIGRLRWIASVVGARFNFDLHNDRRLAEHRGAVWTHRGMAG